MEYTTRSCTPDKDFSLSLSLSSRLVEASSRAVHVLAPTESAQHVRPRKVHVTSPLFVHRRPVCTRVSGAGYGCKGGVEGGGGSGGLGLCFVCFWGFSAAPGVYAREGNVDIAAFVWPPRLVSPPPPPLPPPLSLFDEATGSSTHRHHLLHHPQPFLLLFPSPPFLTTGLPCLSYPPSPHRS